MFYSSSFYSDNICYLDAWAAAGKTYQLIRLAHERASAGEKVLFVQPTKQLIDVTAAELRGLRPAIPVKVIHSGTDQGTVTKEIVAHFKNACDGGQVLLITQESFDRVQYFQKQRYWHLVIDEIPKVEWCGEWNLPETHRVITDYLDTGEDHFGAHILGCTKYRILKANDRGMIRRIAENAGGDDIWSGFQALAYKIMSPNWITYVDGAAYDNLKAGNSRKLTAFAVRRPSSFTGFNTVLIAGALFKDAMLHRLLSKRGVTFVPDTDLQSKLRYRSHDNGRCVTIHYASEEPWSKRLRDRGLGAAFRDAVAKVYGDDPFLWMANVDMPEGSFSGSPGAQRLPNAPHGLNSYADFDHVAVLSALNPTPAHCSFLMEHEQMQREDIYTAILHHAVYQAVMRSSLRDPVNVNPKTIIVPDKASATWLSRLFLGSVVKSLGIDTGPTKANGRPRVRSNDTEKKRVYRDRKLNKDAASDLMARLNQQFGPSGDGLFLCSVKKNVHESPTLYSGFVDNFCRPPGNNGDDTVPGRFLVSLFRRYGSKQPFGILSGGNDDFIDLLKEMSQEVVGRKTDLYQFSAALYDPSLNPDHDRGLDNVVVTSGIWLDNDGGDLTLDAFVGLFPGLRIVAYNTFNSTIEKPRWRIYIPTAALMPAEVYEAITHDIIRRIETSGYPVAKPDPERPGVKAHGFDTSKLHAASLFHRPSLAKDPSGSHFQIVDGQPLDPYVWMASLIDDDGIDTAIPPEEPVNRGIAKNEEEKPVNRGIAKNDALVQRAIRLWHETHHCDGNDHGPFFKLACRLANAGCNEGEIIAHLSEEAAQAYRPDTRRAKIEDYLASLRRYGLFQNAGT